MRRTAVVVVASLLALACQRETQSHSKNVRVHTKLIPEDARNVKVKDAIRTPSVQFLQLAKIGTKLAPGNTVDVEETKIAQGTPVYLTMWLRESPIGLNTSAQWYGSDEKIVKRDVRAMNGGKIATFSLDTAKLEPGKYRVEGFWGGNVAVEKAFEVVAGK